MLLPAFALLAVLSAAKTEDSETVAGIFRSERNSIDEVHFESLGSRDFLILKLGNPLTGRNSRGRLVEEKRANYGDSKSVYVYLEIAKADDFRVKAAAMALDRRNQVDIFYSCGDQPDDAKRKTFPLYAETNCELQTLTLGKPKEARGFGW